MATEGAKIQSEAACGAWRVIWSTLTSSASSHIIWCIHLQCQNSCQANWMFEPGDQNPSSLSSAVSFLWHLNYLFFLYSDDKSLSSPSFLKCVQWFTCPTWILWGWKDSGLKNSTLHTALSFCGFTALIVHIKFWQTCLTLFTPRIPHSLSQGRLFVGCLLASWETRCSRQSSSENTDKAMNTSLFCILPEWHSEFCDCLNIVSRSCRKWQKTKEAKGSRVTLEKGRVPGGKKFQEARMVGF